MMKVRRTSRPPPARAFAGGALSLELGEPLNVKLPNGKFGYADQQMREHWLCLPYHSFDDRIGTQQ